MKTAIKVLLFIAVMTANALIFSRLLPEIRLGLQKKPLTREEILTKARADGRGFIRVRPPRFRRCGRF